MDLLLFIDTQLGSGDVTVCVLSSSFSSLRLILEALFFFSIKEAITPANKLFTSYHSKLFYSSIYIKTGKEHYSDISGIRTPLLCTVNSAYFD